MSDLDRELRDAVAASEEQAASEEHRASDEHRALDEHGDADDHVTGVVRDRAPPDQASRGRSIGLLIGLLVVGGSILALVFTSVDEAAIYSVTTDQLVDDAAKYADKTVRVEGDLVKGSLRHRAEPCEYRFSITKGGKQIPVRYARCEVPDTFRDVPDMDVQVTAEGELSPEGHFDASHIMAKCPSKYEMKKKAASGEAAPHGAPGAGPEIPPIVD